MKWLFSLNFLTKENIGKFRGNSGFIPASRQMAAMTMINPLHGERGKFYYAIRCGNKSCHEKLPLAEIRPYPSPEKNRQVRDSLKGLTVRCLMCTHQTLVEERLLFVLEVR